jgi:hypothetical protein
MQEQSEIQSFKIQLILKLTIISKEANTCQTQVIIIQSATVLYLKHDQVRKNKKILKPLGNHLG